jgi:1-acyl-sn-glycerol-3-phosphate acyltransferase
MTTDIMSSPLLSTVRLLLYLLWNFLSIPIQAILICLDLSWQESLPVIYHRVCVKLLGFKVIAHGRPLPNRPTLFVANHISYLDIMILGSLIKGSFIAKHEVNTWPFFGLLARLQRTVFINRRMTTISEQRNSLIKRLEAGDSLILFPEGTSSDGNHTLPFKSALFAIASVKVNSESIMIQPVSLTCTALDDIPLGRFGRQYYAWYGDMDLLPHIWAVAGLGCLTVTVEFHSPLTLEQSESRKTLADSCWAVIAHAVANANAGRS